MDDYDATLNVHLKTQTKSRRPKNVKRRSNKCPNAHAKAAALLAQLLAKRKDSLFAAQRKIARALRKRHGEAASDIAFHLSEWNGDAWFIVAVFLFPDRFTAAEIRDGITGFLVHAPNHIAAAAKLAGWPVEDVIRVGALGKKRLHSRAVLKVRRPASMIRNAVIDSKTS